MIKQYSYKVISTNEESNSMEVVFSSSGYPDVLVGTRLPYENEDVEQLIQSFAPLHHWATINLKFTPVEVGKSGTVIIPDAPEYIQRSTVQPLTTGSQDF